MKFRILAAAAAATTLAVAPVVAQAAPQRAAAPTEEASEMGGSGWLLGILALAAFIAAIIIATKGENDPVSP